MAGAVLRWVQADGDCIKAHLPYPFARVTDTEAPHLHRGFDAVQSLPASAAVPGVRARVAPGCSLGQPGEVMGPAFRMANALLDIGQAGVSQAQQRSARL